MAKKSAKIIGRAQVVRSPSRIVREAPLGKRALPGRLKRLKEAMADFEEVPVPRVMVGTTKRTEALKKAVREYLSKN